MNRFVPCFVLLLWGFCPGANAQPATKRAAPSSENRFLFIVETSAATKRIAEASQRAVVQLLSDDISGQMRPGDSFSIWTYNETLNAGRFPAQRWNPEARSSTLRQVTEFLGTVKFEKNGRLEVVRPAIEAVTQGSPKLTIILVTDGKQQVSGLRFDPEINKLFEDNYTAMREAKMPFVTILVARSGEFVAFTVNSTLGPIKYPPPPTRTEIVAEAAPAHPTAPEGQEPSPTPVPTVATPTPTLPVSVPEPAKPAPVNRQISQDPRLVSSGPTPAGPTKIVEASPPSAVQPMAPPIGAQITTPANNANPTPLPHQIEVGISAEKPAEPRLPEGTTTKTKEPNNSPAGTLAGGEVSTARKSESAKPAIAVINPVEAATGRRPLLGTALALALVAIFLGYLLLRPKRNSSLITKSMHRAPK